MTSAPRHRLASLLADESSALPLSVHETVPPDDLAIAVRGIGPIGLPVSAVRAKELRLVSRRAPYGLGEQTLVDRSVRDAWQVPRSRIKIDKRRWNRTLNPMLDRFRQELGLPETCRLRAELHSMLVYEPGGFFAPHQDSEKHDGMVGSLVVMLPSNATGGELVVGQGRNATEYRGSRTSLSTVAFYSDTIHEVRTVRTGYRVVLTYDLVVADGGPVEASDVSGVDRGAVGEIALLLNRHFTLPADVPSWMRDRGSQEPPDRLVYLLDHQYTERGLSWSTLKGSDGPRAATLRAAADGADCEAVLAVANVNEVWDAFERHWSQRGSGRRSRPTDFDLGEGVPDDLDDYELSELIDSSVTLHPVSGATMAADVGSDELCESTPSIKLAPYESEYEGYMGNYGNTMDRWYRRAAVVVWPRSRDFVVRAEGDPVWALDELAALFVRDPDSARASLAALVPYWSGATQRLDDPRAALPKTLAVATMADDGDAAAALLAPFTVIDLGPDDAPALVAAVDRHGVEWGRPWLRAWAESPGSARAFGGPAGFGGLGCSGRTTPGEWVDATLAPLCGAIVAEGSPSEAVADAVVGAAFAWLRSSLARAAAISAPSQRDRQLADLGPMLCSLLAAADITGSSKVTSEAVELVTGGGADPRLLPCLVSAVLDGGDRPSAIEGLDAVARYCEAQLASRVARPLRDADDWAIELPMHWCDCADCEKLSDFLADRVARDLEWPLAKPRRQHIHQVLDGPELPVSHTTKRTGSPHKLMLTKTAELFERERQIRNRDQADLVLLQAMT